jgi:hypothetical protein
VKDHAANKAPRLSESSTRKTSIAEWIEHVETLAVDPHPKSNMSCKSLSYTYTAKTNAIAATKKEDLIEAPGLKTTASKAKGDKVSRAAPRKKPGQKKATSPTEDKVVAQSIVSTPSKTANSDADLKRKREYEVRYHEFRKRSEYPDTRGGS